MKKLFNLLLLCTACLSMFSSCTKEDEKESTYTFIYDASTLLGEESVILFEYDKDGDKINSNSIECEKGYTKTFTATINAEKIKVYINSKWVQQVFPLKKGGNINIKITGETLIGKQEP